MEDQDDFYDPENAREVRKLMRELAERERQSVLGEEE